MGEAGVVEGPLYYRPSTPAKTIWYSMDVIVVRRSVAVVASSVSLVCVKPLPVAPPRNGSDCRGPSGHSRKRASPTTTPRAAPKNQQGGPCQGGGGGGGRLSRRLTRREEKYQNERSKTGERERKREREEWKGEPE